ncbi:hypothetical protein [Paraburkholderia sediminicola]|uniref:hypothetical protein n=1 Tax=Paraburkholderia sediminicola TaxID=458836 RepID=UPI0038BB6FA3
MNSTLAVFFVNILAVTVLVGCPDFPHISIDYSSLGQTRLDSELMTHWQTGTEPLRRDVQKIVDSYNVQGDRVSVETLEAMGAHCLSVSQNRYQYTGIIRYRLFGLPDASKDGKLTTIIYHIDIQRQMRAANVTVERKEIE